VCEVLESGVRTAYQVIDEYMRRGYEAAGNNQNDPNKRGHMNENRANYNWQNPWGPMSQLTEQWMMAMRTWTEAWSAFVPGGWPQQPWNPAGPCNPNAPVVSVQVSSPRPTEVTANLRPGAELMDLVVDALHGEGPQAPSFELSTVSITRELARMRVNVRVGANVPAGSYRGAIRNRADGCIVGDLTVVITESATEKA